MRLLCISINLPYGHTWKTVAMSGLMLLFATWNYWMSCKNGYAGLLVFTCCLSSTLGSLSSLFYWYYFGKCSSELAQLGPLPSFQGRATHYSDRLHYFSVTIPRCYKDVYVNSFFPCTSRLRNFLPIECFPLTYDLNEFRSRINRHLLTVGFFVNRLPVCFNLFGPFFL